MFKKLFSSAALLLVGLGVQAQTTTQSNTVYPGANGAQTTIIQKAIYGYVQFLSGDARYISGLLGGAAGFAYDIEKDTCLMYEDCTLPGFISPDHYAGQDDPGETVVNAFAYYNGTKSPLEHVLESGKPSYDDVFITAVQGNGDNLVTMVYEQYERPNGTPGFINIVAIHDGKTGKLKFKLPTVWERPVSGDALGFGARGDCISGDGTVVGGHSTNPFTPGKWSLAFWDISDPDNIQSFGIEDEGFDFGTFYGANYDGSVLVGSSESNGQGVIVNYDKTNKKFSYKTVSPLPGWDMVAFTGVADNGTIIGYCGMALDPGTREPVFYTELTGLVKMNEFLYEYYDIDLQKQGLYIPIAISRDGSIQTGFFYNDEGYPLPWYHRLGSERILPRARKISARAARGTLEVSVNWQQPFKSEHTLQGYNIYRDDEETPLNGSTLLPVSTNDYTDKPEAGRHTYYIEAVYDKAPSMKAASNTVQVVAPGECFPVQTVGHRLEYNRYATIFWGQPSSEVAALAKNDHAALSKEPKGKFDLQLDATETAVTATVQSATAPRPKSYTSTTLDYIANVDMLTYSGFAGIKIGNYYYTSSHLGGGIQVIDQYNEIVRVISPEGLGAVMAMVYDDETNKLYCGTLTGIKVIDLDNDEMDIIAPVAARFLAYVPELDGGKGGFVAGREHSCNTYTMEGELIESDIFNFRSPIYACGAAYHNGRLYVSSASGKYYNEIYVFDFEKRTQIGEPIQVVEDPALYGLLTFDGLLPLTGITQAGSLSVCTLEDGTTALGAVFQCAYITTRLMLLEIESDASVKGYDLYRNLNGGEYTKLNGDTPLATRRYAETLTDTGKYAYYVVVIPQNADAPESAASPVDTISVSATSGCPKPTFTVRESNRWPVMDWMPSASENILVGFNLYRGETALGRFWLDDMCLTYVDDKIDELGTYTYKLEVVYEDGCVATETADITLTGLGTALAPFGLTLEAESSNATACTVKAAWETPMFEEPLALRYCNAVTLNAVTFDNYYECWAAVGWDTANLDLYRDLYLVGMEYLIGAMPKTFEGFVILNNEMVHTQTIARPIARDWQTVFFDKSFSMDQPHEVAVGYHTTYTAENVGVLTVDESVSKSGYSDLITLDGKQWSTLKAGGKKGSWCISALVVHKRDLDAAKKADGTIDRAKLEGSLMRMAINQPLNAEVTTLPETFTVKPSAKEGLNLIGFNIYRRPDTGGDDEDVKLNDALLTTFEFTDAAAPKEEMLYTIGAVYTDGQEIKTEKYIDLTNVSNDDLAPALTLNLYPNPTTDLLNIDGEYETLQILDMSGRLLRTHKATAQVSLGGLQPGTYFFHFTSADGHKAVYKVVVR